MKKQILFIACLIVTLMLSIGTISANDSVTDSYTTNSVDDTPDVSVPTSYVAGSSQDSESNDGNANSNVDDASKVSLSGEESLESENSNSLSTDTLTNTQNSGEDTKKNTTLNATNTNVYYKSGKFSAILSDSNNIGISGQNITILLNGIIYTKITDSNGIASVDITLNPGKYTATISYFGNEEYEAASNVSATVTVLPTIKSNDVTKYYKGSTKYTATFLNGQGQPLANRNVKIIVNGKTYTVKTDAKGVASLAIDLKPGTYKVIAQDPDTGYSLTNTFKILTTISATNLNKVYTDNKRFYATFLNSNGKALSNKYIRFRIAGKTYKVKTNAKGVASLSLTKLKKGTYSIISYNTDGLTKTNTVKVIATTKTKIVTSSYIYLTGKTKTIKATLLNSLGYGVSGKTIRITVNGRTYRAKTNSNGVATIKLGKMNKGLYNVAYRFYKNGVYKASSASNKLMVLNNNNVAYTIKSGTTFIKGTNTQFKVALTASGIALAKRTVTLKLNDTTYVKTTDNNGIVSVPINLDNGSYVISYSYNGESQINAKTGSTVLTVKEPTDDNKIVSVNNIINSAVTLKNYYDTNKKLPNTITSGGYTFTIPEFLYLMSKALHQLGSSNMANILALTGVSGAPSPSGDNINSKELYKENYLTLAKNTANFIENNHRAPNYVSSSLGKIIYEELVDAMARGLNFYKENNRLPNYLIISQGSGSSGITGKGLNYKENLNASEIAKYLEETTNCQVNNAAITKIVQSVTKGLSSDYAKAKAIFEYVRDKLTYSFYFNTKYGAVNALSNKKGNCVDHTHLIVAMCRNAGIAARYVHGVCTFSSGSTYGHVWAQIYVNGQWIVADGTSSRNTFGNIVNWNTKSFTLKNIYRILPF